MLDYGFARSPGGRCSDFIDRGHHGRGITSRALVCGVEYSHFFLNPLAEGSHEEGVPIPYAGAATFGSEMALHNPLAEEYNSGDDLIGPSPDSTRSCMLSLSFLAFTRPFEIGTDCGDCSIPEASSSLYSNTTKVNKAVKPSNQHHFKAHPKVVAVTTVTNRTITALPPKPTVTSKRPEDAKATGNSNKYGTKPRPLQLRMSKSQIYSDRPPSPHEPCAPRTPPLASQDGTMTLTAPRRWCDLYVTDQHRQKKEKKEKQQQRQQKQRRWQGDLSPSPQAWSPAAHVAISSKALNCTALQKQYHQKQTMGSQELLQLQLEVKEQGLPLMPWNGSPLLPPTPPLPQEALLELCVSSQTPMEPPLFPTLVSYKATNLRTTGRTFVATAADTATTPAISTPISHSITCNSGNNSFPSAANPGCHFAGTVAVFTTAQGFRTAHKTLGATSPGLNNHATVAMCEADSKATSCGNTSSFHSNRWTITDNCAPCSISGLAMTRAIIRLLGLLPPNILAATE